jgi:hypothetical protein
MTSLIILINAKYGFNPNFLLAHIMASNLMLEFILPL